MEFVIKLLPTASFFGKIQVENVYFYCLYCTNDMTKEELYDEAVALYEKGDLDNAIEKMNALSLQYPEYALPHTALSVWYYKRGALEESMAHAKKTAELEPNDPFSYVALSLLAQRAGDHAVAEEALFKSQYI